MTFEIKSEDSFEGMDTMLGNTKSLESIEGNPKPHRRVQREKKGTYLVSSAQASKAKKRLSGVPSEARMSQFPFYF